MTKGDAARLIGVITTAYPNSDKFIAPKAVENAVNLWADFFVDDNEIIVAMTVKKHIATSKWPPSIAEIREIMTDIQNPDLIPPDEAWAIVARYIDVTGEYGGWNHSENMLPAPIIRAVNAIGYQNLLDLRIRRFDNGDKKTGLDRVAFIQAYGPEYERARINAAMPSYLRKAIVETQKALSGENRRLIEKTNNFLDEKERGQRELYDRIERRQYAYLQSGGTLRLEEGAEE